MEQVREALCGPKWRRDPDRQAGRGRSTPSEVTLGGRRLAVRRPRVRSREGAELDLPSFAFAAARDPLDTRTLDAIASGVSTRKYLFLGSSYMATHTGGPMDEGVPWLGMTAMAFGNVALLYHRKGGPVAYILNEALILADVIALLFNSFLAGFFEDRDAIAWVGSTAIAAAVVNVMALRWLSMRHP